MDNAVAKLYQGLGAAPEDRFYLAYSGASAIEEVLLSTYVDFIRETGRTHIVTTPIENQAMERVFKRLEKLGCTIKRLPLSAQGQLLPEVLEEAIRPRTALLALSWANPFTGVVHPIFDLARLCKEKEVRVLVDATAVLGKLYFRFQDLDIDFLVFDGVNGGGLLTKPSHRLDFNTIEEESRIINFAASVCEELSRFDHLCTETVRLRDRFEEGVCLALPATEVVFHQAERLATISALAIPGVDSEALAFLLNRKGISAHFDPHTISFALTHQTTEEEVDRMVAALIEAGTQLRALSSQLTESV